MKWSWEKARQRRWDSNPQQSKWKSMRVRNLLTAPLTLPGKVDFPTTITTTPPLTTLLPACISWLIGSPRQWRIIMKQAVFGKCLGMLCSDVWQNENVHSWKWECHNHGRGVSSTGWWVIGWGPEVIFTSSSGMSRSQQNFPHLLTPKRKWVQMKTMQTSQVYFQL